MRWLFSLCFLLYCYAAPCNIVLQTIDKNWENKEEVIGEILQIQRTLVLPLDIAEMPAFAETGFLTIGMTPEYLQGFLEEGMAIVAFEDERMVGYLLLDRAEGFLKWAEGRKVSVSLEALREWHYIDQIAVLTECSKQGIGKALVEEAKNLAPNGLMVDILIEPYCNAASLAFFAKQGFTPFAIMEIEANHLRPAHKISVLTLLDDHY